MEETGVMQGTDVHASKDLEKVGPPVQTIVRDITDPTSGVASNLLGIPLYGYNQLPHFLRGNPHITEGYRAHLSTELCVKRLERYNLGAQVHNIRDAFARGVSLAKNNVN